MGIIEPEPSFRRQVAFWHSLPQLIMHMRTLCLLLAIVYVSICPDLWAEETPPAIPPVPAATAPQRVAPADAAAVKSATALVREVYAVRYAVKTAAGKRKLARMMVEHAEWHRSNAALAEVLLRESLRLACEADDHATVLAAIDALDATFTGISIAEERAKAFKETARKPFIVALQKVVETPDDARACGVAGRWLGPIAGRWQEAVPVLGRASGEAHLQKAAMAEVAATNPTEVLLAAEIWMDVTKRTKGEERIGILKHVFDLAQRVKPQLAGISQTKAVKLIDTAEAQIPLDLSQVEWSKLTGKQWDRIAAPEISLLAKTDRTDSGIILADGETVRVVPNPEDRWSFNLAGEDAPVVTGWKGVPRLYKFTVNDSNGIRSMTVMLGVQGILYGAVVAFTDVNKRKLAGNISGPGKLWLGPASNRKGETGTSGTIRVKIVPVDE
jgi:hypothetical protein